MAHFAEIGSDNIVKRVVVIHNNELLVDGVEQEAKGIEFCESLFGGTWVQTSFNGNFRKNFAGPDYTYDQLRDAFIPPKPYESWVLNEDSCKWEPPIPYPSDGEIYYWDEPTISWVK